MQQVKNEFGGNCPQERLDRIKAAWLTRYGAPESAWIIFDPQTEVMYNDRVTSFNPADFDSFAVEQQKAEFPLCPHWAEMAERYKSKSRYHLAKARRENENGNRSVAMKHFDEAVFWRKMAKTCVDMVALIASKN